MKIKKESQYFQGICTICNKNKQTIKRTDKKSKRKIYRHCCKSCLNKKQGKSAGPERVWFKYKKDICESCGFIPENKCQLDVDHIDGNKNNNDPSNFKTLCANCHRLKTYLNREWGLKYR